MDYTSTIKSENSLITKLARADYDSITDDAWIAMLHDHKNFIRGRSVVKTLTAHEKYYYRYRVDRLLKESSGSDKSHIVFCIANDFKDVYDLNESVDQVYIPQAKYVDELRMQYKTTLSIKNKAKVPSEV